MTTDVTFNNNLSDTLPKVRGSYEDNASLIKYTWFRTGGPAEVLYNPADIDDLMVFMASRPKDVAVTFIGLGSNVIIRDGGIPGVVVRLGKSFAVINAREDHLLVGGGALDSAVSGAARDAGLTGMEFLSGVPGTKDIVSYARVIDNKGKLQIIQIDDLGYGYRSTSVPEDWIFVGAMLTGTPGDRGVIARKMEEIRMYREESHPMRTRTGGSTFRNPDPEGVLSRKAWELIDSVEGRGLTLGGAKISEKHCNFLINTGDATSQELEDLGETVRKRVLSRTGISLQWEIRRIGRQLSDIPGEG
jgi:UDP-N-acetylmuramate dehydrogenase